MLGTAAMCVSWLTLHIKKKLCTLILMIKLDNSLTTENRQMSSGSEQIHKFDTSDL